MIKIPMIEIPYDYVNNMGALTKNILINANHIQSITHDGVETIISLGTYHIKLNDMSGAVYDEMGYTNVTGPFGTYGRMKDEAYYRNTDPAVSNLGDYPTYCSTRNCHNYGYSYGSGWLDGISRAWFDPIQE